LFRKREHLLEENGIYTWPGGGSIVVLHVQLPFSIISAEHAPI
jgi:hypothetical protein